MNSVLSSKARPASLFIERAWSHERSLFNFLQHKFALAPWPLTSYHLTRLIRALIASFVSVARHFLYQILIKLFERLFFFFLFSYIQKRSEIGFYSRRSVTEFVDLFELDHSVSTTDYEGIYERSSKESILTARIQFFNEKTRSNQGFFPNRVAENFDKRLHCYTVVVLEQTIYILFLYL